ncbi:hypothetical protein DFH06DRAFT_1218101 [Mycena polygramma]|nr:hypothetical protein DFH06DRAFT_1218101 [Mycena polygramma]
MTLLQWPRRAFAAVRTLRSFAWPQGRTYLSLPLDALADLGGGLRCSRPRLFAPVSSLGVPVVSDGCSGTVEGLRDHGGVCLSRSACPSSPKPSRTRDTFSTNRAFNTRRPRAARRLFVPVISRCWKSITRTGRCHDR